MNGIFRQPGVNVSPAIIPQVGIVDLVDVIPGAQFAFSRIELCELKMDLVPLGRIPGMI
jgi:hypothetical protein